MFLSHTHTRNNNNNNINGEGKLVELMERFMV